MRAHTIGKGLHAAQAQPALKRRGYAAAIVLEVSDTLKECIGLTEDERSGKNVTMSGDIFGDRVHYHIRPEFERLLKERGGAGIVTGHHGASLFCQRNNGAQVS